MRGELRRKTLRGVLGRRISFRSARKTTTRPPVSPKRIRENWAPCPSACSGAGCEPFSVTATFGVGNGVPIWTRKCGWKRRTGRFQGQIGGTRPATLRRRIAPSWPDSNRDDLTASPRRYLPRSVDMPGSSLSLAALRKPQHVPAQGADESSEAVVGWLPEFRLWRSGCHHEAGRTVHAFEHQSPAEQFTAFTVRRLCQTPGPS